MGKSILQWGKGKKGKANSLISGKCVDLLLGMLCFYFLDKVRRVCVISQD